MPPNYPEGIDIDRCFSRNETGFHIELGPGKLQLSVLTAKTKAPIKGDGIQDFLQRKTDVCDLEKVMDEYKSGVLSLSKARLKMVMYGLPNECQLKAISSRVVFDLKKFHTRIQDVSQVKWCQNGGHKVFVILEAAMSRENKLFFINSGTNRVFYVVLNGVSKISSFLICGLI